MTQVSPSPSHLTFSQVASPDHHSSIIHIDRPFFFRPHILCSQPYYQADLIGVGPLKLDSKSNYFLNMSNYWRLSYFLLPIAIQQLAKHDFSKLFFGELLELLLACHYTWWWIQIKLVACFMEGNDRYASSPFLQACKQTIWSIRL